MQRVDALPEVQGRPESRERLAWAILLFCFGIFVFLIVSVPLGVRWYLQHATRAQTATVQSSSGTTLVVMQTAPDPFAVVEGMRKESIEEGSVIRTDSTSQAIVTLFERSQVTIFPNSEVRLTRMRRPRFGSSTKPLEIVAEVTRGRVRADVMPSGARPVAFQVRTPQAQATFDAGNYTIEVNNDLSHVVVRSGVAQVLGQSGAAVTVTEGRRSDVRLGQSASMPLSAARNLITNGALQKPLSAVPLAEGPIAEGWSVYKDQGGDGPSVDGMAEIGIWGYRRSIRFFRTNSGNNHGETGIQQPLHNRYVGDYSSVRLRVDVNIVNQSLGGGGQQSSEFPIIVRINYRDSYDNENHWIHGFFYENPQGYHIEKGQMIPRDTWYSFEADLKGDIPDLVYLSSIQIYASGWDYETFVSNVELIAE